jgi:hypothetical protein
MLILFASLYGLDFVSEILSRLTHKFSIRLPVHTMTTFIVSFAVLYTFTKGDTQWRSWLRHCATSHKVAGSIPD